MGWLAVGSITQTRRRMRRTGRRRRDGIAKRRRITRQPRDHLEGGQIRDTGKGRQRMTSHREASTRSSWHTMPSRCSRPPFISTPLILIHDAGVRFKLWCLGKGNWETFSYMSHLLMMMKMIKMMMMMMMMMMMTLAMPELEQEKNQELRRVIGSAEKEIKSLLRQKDRSEVGSSASCLLKGETHILLLSMSSAHPLLGSPCTIPKSRRRSPRMHTHATFELNFEMMVGMHRKRLRS
jgi:hypothetical protein